MLNPAPSDAAIVLLKTFEQGPSGGFAPVPYRCPAGYKTIGWGHRLIPGEQLQEPITAAAAENLLRDDLLKASDIVRQAVRVRLTQSMVDALASFVFNIGAGRFLGSTLLNCLNSGQYAAAADQLLRWNKKTTPTGEKVTERGLMRRRKVERDLFLRDGVPT